MKRILALALALFASATFAATLNPIQLLNPAGSTAGQAILSTGPSTAPHWASVTLDGISGFTTTGFVYRNSANSYVIITPPIIQGVGGTGLSTLAAHQLVVGGSGNAMTPLAVGSAGQELVSNGASADPSFQSRPGRLLNIRVFTTSGTYTPTTGTAAVYVKVQAGGGAGGGVQATSTGQAATGSGGTAGAYAEGYYTTGFSGVTITVGAGGASASGAAGGAGATSSFGALLSCPGGAGGSVGVPNAGPVVIVAGSVTAACTGTSLFANLGLPGGQGIVISPTVSKGGDGMGTVFGAAVLGNWSAPSPGLSAKAPGASGPGANIPASTAALAGGPGAAGIVEVYEFSQ